MTRQAREQFIATLAMLLTLAVGGALVGGLSGGLLVPIAAVLAMAYAKGRFVILDFMELREAPRLWRVLLEGWLILVSSLILLAYWISLR